MNSQEEVFFDCCVGNRQEAWIRGQVLGYSSACGLEAPGGVFSNGVTSQLTLLHLWLSGGIRTHATALSQLHFDHTTKCHSDKDVAVWSSTHATQRWYFITFLSLKFLYCYYLVSFINFKMLLFVPIIHSAVFLVLICGAMWHSKKALAELC
jgi:hypothetical protein